MSQKDITFFIAVVSFVLSIAQLIYTIYSKRTRFTVEIKNVEKCLRGTKNTYIFTFLINNLSSAYLVLTQVTIQNVNCQINHRWIGERYYPKFHKTDIPCTERIFTSELPLNFAPHSGAIHHLMFQVEKDEKINLASPLLVTFQTSNKKKTIKLNCPEPQYLLEL